MVSLLIILNLILAGLLVAAAYFMWLAALQAKSLADEAKAELEKTKKYIDEKQAYADAKLAYLKATFPLIF